MFIQRTNYHLEIHLESDETMWLHILDFISAPGVPILLQVHFLKSPAALLLRCLTQ